MKVPRDWCEHSRLWICVCLVFLPGCISDWVVPIWCQLFRLKFRLELGTLNQMKQANDHKAACSRQLQPPWWNLKVLCGVFKTAPFSLIHGIFLFLPYFFNLFEPFHCLLPCLLPCVLCHKLRFHHRRKHTDVNCKCKIHQLETPLVHEKSHILQKNHLHSHQWAIHLRNRSQNCNGNRLLCI